MDIRKKIKQAAQWAAFCVLAVATVVAASLIGAELAGAEAKVGWALAKLAGLGTLVLCLVGWLCEQLED